MNNRATKQSVDKGHLPELKKPSAKTPIPTGSRPWQDCGFDRQMG